MAQDQFTIEQQSANIKLFFSGESGAGKTESAKLLISQLVELSRGTSQLEQQILQVLCTSILNLFC